MKIFTEPNGIFSIKIPNEWQYKNEILKADDKTPHSFELYDDQIGCFCISCKSKKNGSFPAHIKNNNLITQEIGKTDLIFKENKQLSGNLCVHFWMATVGDKFILASYNYEISTVNKKRVAKEISKARKALATLICIKDEDKEKFLAHDRYDKFMVSLVAVIDLINRAYDNGSSIELIVLLANRVDALLRLSIILKNQIINKNDYIDTSLLFQGKSDEPISERKIYKLAFDTDIIAEDLFNELNELYDERNKVVHRYIITDLKTMDIINIVYKYGMLDEKISKIVNKLEEQQFKLKIGIHNSKKPPSTPPNQKEFNKIINSLKDKHANKEINKGITIIEKSKK